MGEDGITSDSPTFTQTFEEVFPYYLAWGMSYDEFWNSDSIKAYYYRKAHEISLQEQNQMLWLQGIYTSCALNSTVCNMFAKKHERSEYPNEPIPITENDIKEKQEREAKEKAERMKSRFIQLALQINSNFNRKE